MEKDFTDIRSAQIITGNVYFFLMQKIQNEFRKDPADTPVSGHGRQEMGTPKDLGDQLPAQTAETADTADEEFNGIAGVTQRILIGPGNSLPGQQDVIHPPGLLNGVMNANRNAGAQQRVDNRRFLTDIEFTDMNGCLFFQARYFNARLSDRPMWPQV